MPNTAVTAAMVSAIEALDDLRSAVECWKAEIATVVRVVNILPVITTTEPKDGD